MTDKKIWFDMDGTIADLYGEKNWLEDIINERTDCYENAKPLLRLNTLARKLNTLRAEGFMVCIVTWLPRDAKTEYNRRVEKAKRDWLTKHLKSVEFDIIDILEYGTPKHENRNGILFDDELPNREQWGEGGYNADEIMEILKTL